MGRSMARKYKKMRFADRVKIEEMCKANKSVIQIAETTGVCRDAIYKEFARAGMTRETYNATVAQQSI